MNATAPWAPRNRFPVRVYRAPMLSVAKTAPADIGGDPPCLVAGEEVRCGDGQLSRSTKTDYRPRRLSTKDAEGGKVGDDGLELLGRRVWVLTMRPRPPVGGRMRGSQS
jgi:hypothetical protein